MPGASYRLVDFGEAPLDVISRGRLDVVIGAKGGIGGIDPKTGRTRWKRSWTQLKRWFVEDEALLVVADVIARTSLDNGEAAWEVPLGCGADGVCSLQYLAHDHKTIYLGGFGEEPDSLMLVDTRTGRELWPSWLPLGTVISRVLPGEKRFFVFEGGPQRAVSALSVGSGFRQWRYVYPDKPAPGAVVSVTEVERVVCLTYALGGASGASTSINIDILDAETGQTRLSRTVLAPERGRVARPRCLPGPPGTILLASGDFVEQIDLASLATRQRLSLPGELIDVVVLPGVPGRQASVLFTSAGTWGFAHPSPALRALEINSAPLKDDCRGIPDGVQCPNLALFVNSVTPRLAVPSKDFSGLATHGGRLYGLSKDAITPFVVADPALLGQDTRRLAREGSLDALVARVATLARLRGGALPGTTRTAQGPATATLGEVLSLGARGLGARLTISADDPAPALARLWNQAALPAQDIAHAVLTWRYGADDQAAAAFLEALARQVPLTMWSPGMLVRGAGILERGGRGSTARQLLGAVPASAPESAGISGQALEGRARREVEALVARARAALARDQVDEAEDALLAVLTVQGRSGLLADDSDALIALTNMEAWDDAGMKRELRGALRLIDRALADAGPAEVDPTDVDPASRRCLVDCAQVARDCRFLFPSDKRCARVPARCEASCRTGRPMPPAKEARLPRGSDAWWLAILGED